MFLSAPNHGLCGGVRVPWDSEGSRGNAQEAVHPPIETARATSRRAQEGCRCPISQPGRSRSSSQTSRGLRACCSPSVTSARLRSSSTGACFVGHCWWRRPRTARSRRRFSLRLPAGPRRSAHRCRCPASDRDAPLARWRRAPGPDGPPHRRTCSDPRRLRGG